MDSNISTLEHTTKRNQENKRNKVINSNLDSTANISLYYDIHHAIWLVCNGNFRTTYQQLVIFESFKSYLYQYEKPFIMFFFSENIF